MKPKHKMVVLHFSGDYADEFDIEFISWVDKQWWKTYKTNLVKQEQSIFPCDCYFGSNEFITFDSADDFIYSFEAHQSDDEQIKFLQRISGESDCIGTSFEFPEIDDDFEEDEY